MTDFTYYSTDKNGFLPTNFLDFWIFHAVDADHRATMPTMTRRISSSSWTGTAVVAALVLLHPFLVPSVYADKDGNVYSFGSNPNIRQRMYWADSKAVLDDLSQFSALYIKFHNCAWSPNQAFFDDDGENR